LQSCDEGPGAEAEAADIGGVVSVLEAVERDLAEIRERDERLADSALAELAKVMARQLDAESTSATSKSMCAGKLHEALDRLRELAPPRQEDDRIEDLASRSRLRLAGGTEA
jgi:hypothetical protein